MKNILTRSSELLQIAATIPKVGSGRIVAAIFFRNRLVSFGYCAKQSSKLQRQFSRTPFHVYIHAEIACIKNATKLNIDLRRAEMIIIRAKFDNNLKISYGLAKPCSGCFRAIEAFELRRVYFSTNEQTIEQL